MTVILFHNLRSSSFCFTAAGLVEVSTLFPWEMPHNVCLSFCAGAKKEAADWEFQSHLQACRCWGSP